jgi:hypothetical protein
MTINSALTLTYNQLSTFAGLENFWNLFDTAFGTQYDYLTAFTLKSQWQSHDFSSFPQIEVVSSDVLGTASGAYAISTNTIYLSNTFISSASQQSLEAVILEEYGHFVDAQVNNRDTAGDKGELFSDLVRGVSLSSAELSRIQTEDDHAVVMIDGQEMEIEMSLGATSYIQLGSFNFNSSQFGNTLIESDSGSFSSSNWLNVTAVNPGNPSYLTGANFDTGIASIGLLGVSPTYTIGYNTPIINSIGEDFGIVVARYSSDDFQLSVSTDGTNFVPTLNFSRDIAIGTGVNKDYFYGSNGSYNAQLYVMPVDLSSFGVALGDSVLKIKIRSYALSKMK